MQTVTPRQLEILRYIRDFRRSHGYSPTMQEIGDHLSLTKVTVFEHVGALEKKGVLLRGEKHRARSLVVSDDFVFPDEQEESLPFVGRIVAGVPLEAFENCERMNLNEEFPADGSTFVLEVAGESMINDHIMDGDYVICQRRNTARNGEIVVALLNDGETTLKRIYREKGKIRLQPANDAFAPIVVDKCEIQGVVIGLMRKY
ncbi:MAG TPA: transcriptional repressor LexA [Phycisphaerae bacterium]|nr:transcriptional repressor LexA [Phycisphaerae bacterium]HPS52182.1 transcriptional repressor LexA [Phycisphaerae bacterium]